MSSRTACGCPPVTGHPVSWKAGLLSESVSGVTFTRWRLCTPFAFCRALGSVPVTCSSPPRAASATAAQVPPCRRRPSLCDVGGVPGEAQWVPGRALGEADCTCPLVRGRRGVAGPTGRALPPRRLHACPQGDGQRGNPVSTGDSPPQCCWGITFGCSAELVRPPVHAVLQERPVGVQGLTR